MVLRLLQPPAPPQCRRDAVTEQLREHRPHPRSGIRNPPRSRGNHTSDADAEKTNAALHQPAIVVILTAAVDYNGTRLRGGCKNLSTVVTPSGPVTQTPEPTQPVTTQNAVVAATSTITCKDLQYLGP